MASRATDLEMGSAREAAQDAKKAAHDAQKAALSANNATQDARTELRETQAATEISRKLRATIRREYDATQTRACGEIHPNSEQVAHVALKLMREAERASCAVRDAADSTARDRGPCCDE